jgi:hypothetical protein
LKKEKITSPESIKIRFIPRSSGGGLPAEASTQAGAAAKASPAPPMAGLGERTLSSQKSEFVPLKIWLRI